MPILKPENLSGFCCEILSNAGMNSRDAHIVAEHLVDAELKNVRSHGVDRVAYYLDQFKAGHALSRAGIHVQRLPGSVLRVDGGKGLGILAMEAAVDALIEGGSSSAISCAGVVNVAHTGRIGAYSERLARAGKLAMVFGGGNGHQWNMVAAHGGRGAAMSTNPWALALPVGDNEIVSSDFATCVVANGKLRILRRTGKPVPEGWLIDKHGVPTTQLDAYDDGGAILPSGEHKGYGLAVIAELVCGAMLGEPHEFNWVIIAIDADAFGKHEDHASRSARIVERLRATPPAPGFDRVRVPGDPERESEIRAREHGVDIDESVWRGLLKAAKQVAVLPPAVST